MKRLLCLLLCLAPSSWAWAAAEQAHLERPDSPLYFEANRGQSASPATYLARGPGYRLALSGQEAVLMLAPSRDTPGQLQAAALRMRFVGASPAVRPQGQQLLPGRSNYLVGPRSEWRQGIPHYAQVRYPALYPGVDLVFYGQGKQLEYDFVVAPGADPGIIALDFQGAREVRLRANGDLLLETPHGTLVQRRPVIYQLDKGVRQPVAGRYLLRDKHRVGFQVARYDHGKPLIIDPVLSYSTYLGGSAEDAAVAARVDSQGNLYLAGNTRSADFPGSRNAKVNDGANDAFVSKFNATGQLLYTSYIGGDGDDQTRALALDASGQNVYLSGATSSDNFNLANGSRTSSTGGGQDIFIAGLSGSDGMPNLFSLFSNDGADSADAIALDSDGNIYIAGRTSSQSGFASAPDILQATYGGGSTDGFVQKLSPIGLPLYSTYFGGSGDEGLNGIAVDGNGNAYVTGDTSSPNLRASPIQAGMAGGTDAFAAKISPDGKTLAYFSYLGGTQTDVGRAIAVDANGNAYVAGLTGSPNFPRQGGLQAGLAGPSDAFVSKLAPDGQSLSFSGTLGGTGADDAFAIAQDASGIYLAGTTTSPDLPAAGAPQATPGGGEDAFLAKLRPDGSGILYTSYLGGSGRDNGLALAIDSSRNIYLAGLTQSGPSAPFPGMLAAQAQLNGPQDAFVSKLLDEGSSSVPPNSLNSPGSASSSPAPVDSSAESSTASGGGCSLNPRAGFDPVLAGMLLAGIFVLWRRGRSA